MKRFADRLREARAAAGLTQEQLGFALGVTKSSVSAWEISRETPSFQLLALLRATLQRSLDELVCAAAPSAVARVAGERSSGACKTEFPAAMTRSAPCCCVTSICHPSAVSLCWNSSGPAAIRRFFESRDATRISCKTCGVVFDLSTELADLKETSSQRRSNSRRSGDRNFLSRRTNLPREIRLR